MKSWRVIDDDTFQVISNGVQVQFLYSAGAVPIVAKHIWAGVAPADFATDPGSTGADPSRVVGTGAFKFKEWQQGQQVVLERNDEYYAKKPDIKEFVLRIFPDSESQFNAFLKGEIDTTSVLPSQMSALAGHNEIATAVYDDRGFFYYEFNLNPDHGTKFADARVRQAFMYASTATRSSTTFLTATRSSRMDRSRTSLMPMRPTRSPRSTRTIPTRRRHCWPRRVGPIPTAMAWSTKTASR